MLFFFPEAHDPLPASFIVSLGQDSFLRGKQPLKYQNDSILLSIYKSRHPQLILLVHLFTEYFPSIVKLVTSSVNTQLIS